MGDLATIATIATGAAAVIGSGSTIYSGYVQQQQGEQSLALQKQQQLDEAHAYESAGKATFAASQRDALERRYQGELTLSAQQAAAAASGGGAGTDAPTVVRLMTETADRAEQGAETDLYGGRAQAKTYYDSADNLRKAAATGAPPNSFVGSLIAGFGELLGGAAQTANVANKYGLVKV